MRKRLLSGGCCFAATSEMSGSPVGSTGYLHSAEVAGLRTLDSFLGAVSSGSSTECTSSERQLE